ncbi:hypothetical protein CKAN_02594900 [Cinnamomum micranthum f. kanehirae]|uniref:Uncharacterized protein n=1 Tax=Cinnamomum micranthum f. kanehirae TaxID=337451 RepID=A0A3S3NQ90_9MAGN|nr:hypothetical protein CKAN_02594900 [Cinnamomum micranthum f. kanehirae]
MRVLQRCIYSITSRDEVIIRLGAIGKEKVHSMLEETSLVILEKSRVQPEEDLFCLHLITVLWFTFFETWKQYNYRAGLAQHHTLYIYCKGKDLLEPTLLSCTLLHR